MPFPYYIFADVSIRNYSLLLLLGCLCWAPSLLAQDNDPEALKAALEEAATPQERYALYYALTTQLTRNEPEEAYGFGQKAYNEAKRLRNQQLMADAAYVTALAYERDRNKGKTESWLKTTTRHAMAAQDANLLLNAVDKRTRMATRTQNYRRATEINREALDYFTADGTDLGTLRANAERDKMRLERERSELTRLRAELDEELEILRDEQEILEEENDQLMAVNEARTAQLEAKEEALNRVEEEKAEVEEAMVVSQRQVAQLSRQALEQQAAVDRVQRELAEKKLAASEAERRAMKAEIVSERSEALRNYAIGLGALLLLLCGLLYYRFVAKRKAAKSLEESNAELAEARKRSDELLLNILPANIAEELKTKGAAKARKFTDTTILFSDFVNFTRISELLGPEDLVRQLDVCFRAFDEILADYPDLEKIKTIGDAYMVASGLDDRKSIPSSLVKAALRMQSFLAEERKRREARGLPYFEARIGMHTGPVVAGVVGLKKFAYDVWGDTVNTASRVESKGEPGKVNISETTYRLIKYQFDCGYRGKVEVKNKGMLDLYYVESER